MATVDNGSILREVYQAWNDKDMDRVVSYSVSDARVVNVPFGTKLGFREYVENWARAFPDGKIEVTNLVAQGDYVIAEFTGRGTHTGPLKGPTGELPATQRRLEMPFVEVVRFRNGKIADGRIYFDAMTFMSQLGLGAGATAAQVTGAGASPQPRH